MASKQYRCKIGLLLLGLILLPGCALFGGGAEYKYKVTESDGRSCEVEIKSLREFGGGAKLKVNKCNVDVEAKSITAGPDNNALMLTLINMLMAQKKEP